MDAYCWVCGEPLDGANSAECDGCGGSFHLVLYQDRPGKDCGRVWVDGTFLTLRFGCFRCLGAVATGRSNEVERNAP